MSTLGFRGLLAGMFAMSLGLLAGASQGAQAWEEAGAYAPADEGPGLLDHARARACAISQGLSVRNERESAERRRHDCNRRHGIDD
ncbi:MULTISPECIES: hypothetical protein [unclassified Arenimonas]|uniref:hypothetical protein n=1 Tax=unclassified Arenimonas TaxID=2641713 RepID=UPI00086D6352|nr:MULTISPECIES: hypothetical protein [unclassified Arenimonas]ODS63491.1 MAG: hypothetical protein ABS41_05605 [Arenimonas sp. SCN 70-307]